MERVLDTDISIFSKFLVTCSFFQYRKTLPNTVYTPNFKLIEPFTQKLQIAYRFAKSPALLRVTKHKEGLKDI